MFAISWRVTSTVDFDLGYARSNAVASRAGGVGWLTSFLLVRGKFFMESVA